MEERITVSQALMLVDKHLAAGKMLDCEVDGTPLTLENATVHSIDGQLLIVCTDCKRDLVSISRRQER